MAVCEYALLYVIYIKLVYAVIGNNSLFGGILAWACCVQPEHCQVSLSCFPSSSNKAIAASMQRKTQTFGHHFR